MVVGVVAVAAIEVVRLTFNFFFLFVWNNFPLCYGKDLTLFLCCIHLYLYYYFIFFDLVNFISVFQEKYTICTIIGK